MCMCVLDHFLVHPLLPVLLVRRSQNLPHRAPPPVTRYLRPALEDDALLLSLEELLLQGVNNYDDDDDDNGSDGEPLAAAATATGVEEEKGGVVDPTAASTTTSAAGGAPETRNAGAATAAGARVAELEGENARLREALREADARMARANRVLRNLAGGGAEGGGGSEEGGDDEEGSVTGVSALAGFFCPLWRCGGVCCCVLVGALC